MRRVTLLGAMACALLLGATAPAEAQDTLQRELRESQLRLEEIRSERQRLQREMEGLRSRVHDAAAQLANIESQLEASARALRELDFQSAALASNVEATTRELVLARDRLAVRKAVLRGRLRAIYKRGPLHTVQVLLSAESFADLLNRYKYLHLIALYDQALVRDVTQLERDLEVQEARLTRNLAQLQRLRADKLQEFAQLQSLEQEHAGALREYRQREQQTERTLRQLERDEARLAGLITELERRRLEEERRRAVAGRPVAEGSITTRDLGALEWPVEGELAYRFGPERRPNGVILRWNGIGIRAPAGTPVRSVEAGTVVMAGPFEGYGPSVMLSHGGGFYTLYLYLASVDVTEGEQVAAQQVIGTVGGERTPEGPHIEFQVRAPVNGGIPEPVDPLAWLRSRSSR